MRVVAVALLGLVLLGGRAAAFPHFARKYETSCQTCHMAMPKLNPFGQAFRDNGFEWPGGEDEMTKDRPVVLSAEANREAFPSSIWPSWLPRSLPMSVLLESELSFAPTHESWISTEGVGGGGEVILGGAISKGIAARVDFIFTADALTKKASVDLELAYLQFRLYKRYLDLRIGVLHPELFSFAPQALGGAFWLWDRPLGDTGFFLASRTGAELRSIFGRGRMRAVLGTAASAGTTGRSWDLWARLGLKLGGIRLDGVDTRGAESASQDPSRPWRDNSVQLNLFAYFGNPRYNDVDDRFLHLGADVSVWLYDLNLTAAFLVGHHDRLYEDTDPGWIYLGTLQLDYVIFPWLVPSARFELAGDALGRPFDKDRLPWRILPGLSAQVRDNVRIFAYCEAGPAEAEPIAFSRLLVGGLAAF